MNLGQLLQGALTFLGDMRPGVNQAMQMYQYDKERKAQEAKDNAYMRNMEEQAALNQERFAIEKDQAFRNKIAQLAQNPKWQTQDLEKIRSMPGMDDMNYSIFLSINNGYKEAFEEQNMNKRIKLLEEADKKRRAFMDYGTESNAVTDEMRKERVLGKQQEQKEFDARMNAYNKQAQSAQLSSILSIYGAIPRDVKKTTIMTPEGEVEVLQYIYNQSDEEKLFSIARSLGINIDDNFFKSGNDIIYTEKRDPDFDNYIKARLPRSLSFNPKKETNTQKEQQLDILGRIMMGGRY